MEDNLSEKIKDLLNKAEQKGHELSMAKLTEISRVLFPDIDPKIYYDKGIGQYKSDVLTQQQWNQIGLHLSKK